jgi:hypothetical protein
MVELHPSFLEKDGKKQFVVLTIEEFDAIQEMLADAEDLLELRRAEEEEGDAETVSLEDVKKQLGIP